MAARFPPIGEGSHKLEEEEGGERDPRGIGLTLGVLKIRTDILVCVFGWRVGVS